MSQISWTIVWIIVGLFLNSQCNKNICYEKRIDNYLFYLVFCTYVCANSSWKGNWFWGKFYYGRCQICFSADRGLSSRYTSCTGPRPLVYFAPFPSLCIFRRCLISLVHPVYKLLSLHFNMYVTFFICLILCLSVYWSSPDLHFLWRKAVRCSLTAFPLHQPDMLWLLFSHFILFQIF